MSIDIRDAFFDTVYDLAAKDPNVVVLSADADAFSLRRFRTDFPDRYVNIGVAEQNMVTVATGLALAGKNVFIYAILPFVTLRCYEQIKFNICGMNLGVTIVGVGVGYSFDFDGPSHHGVTDIGVMRMLPEMEIANPSTPALAAYYARRAHASATPVCVRLDKKTPQEMYDANSPFDGGFNVVREGRDLCLLATGTQVQNAAAIARDLEADGLSVGVIDVHRLKPVDPAPLLAAVAPYRRLATMEENAIVGGLGTVVAEILIDAEEPKPLKRFALPDKQCFETGTRDWLLAQNGLAPGDIAQALRAWAPRSV